MYMTTNQFKAYDYAFIAGEAARDAARAGALGLRPRQAGDPDRPPAGRPLLAGALPYTPDERDRRALRARPGRATAPPPPTARSPRTASRSCAALLATGAHRVIYRPHPRSGVVDPEYGAANRRDHRGDRGGERRRPRGAARLRRRPAARLAAGGGRCRDRRHLGDGLRPAGGRQAAASSRVRLEPGGADRHERIPRGVRMARRDGCRGASSHASTRSPTTPTPARDSASGSSATSATPRRASTTARFHAAVEHLMAEWERHAALHADDEESTSSTTTTTKRRRSAPGRPRRG